VARHSRLVCLLLLDAWMQPRPSKSGRIRRSAASVSGLLSGGPILATLKAVCGYVDDLKAMAELLGDRAVSPDRLGPTMAPGGREA